MLSVAFFVVMLNVLALFEVQDTSYNDAKHNNKNSTLFIMTLNITINNATQHKTMPSVLIMLIILSDIIPNVVMSRHHILQGHWQ